ncbi:hypothetical protein [Streptomyces sp. PT12]|uniref:hypothetical protein n=1 Tax=Streptomyces sp. PT12 TaxID=1510197 RepID=UPI001C665E67|nr:hypothetical protein [Streptomyces sp. PT12]
MTAETRSMAAAHAVVSHTGGPRRLPGDEPLPAEDYRRLFGVYEAVDRAADLPACRERLLRALGVVRIRVDHRAARAHDR